MRKEQKPIRCPRCGSANVTLGFESSSLGKAYVKTCNECGCRELLSYLTPQIIEFYEEEETQVSVYR